MQTATRGWLLTVVAGLFVLLAVSNFLKPLHLNPDAAFVFLGVKQVGVANLILSLLFGAFLIVYALAIWRMKSGAVPMAWGFLVWVVLNGTLFSIRSAPGGSAALAIVSAVVGIGVPLLAAIVLTRRRAELT